MIVAKAQSVAEYSICVAVVLAALLGMQILVKRGLQGKYKDLVDYTTKQASSPHQYSPYYVQDSFRVLQSKTLSEDFKGRGVVNRNYAPDQDKVTVQGTSIRDIK